VKKLSGLLEGGAAQPVVTIVRFSYSSSSSSQTS
jgi:hypothetical protein